MVSKAEEILFAEASLTNQAAAKYFGIAIGGLIACFTLSYWTRKLAVKYIPRSSSLARACASASRPLRRISKGTTIGGFQVLPGRLGLAAVYLAINLAVTLTNIIDWSEQTIFAKRLGWIALCNVCLAVFLGLKNTPLSPLAGRSYDSLNALHRCVGYTTIVYMLLHSSIYVSGLYKAGASYLLNMPHQYAAATSAFSLLLILIMSFFRKQQYELFYVVHVFLVAVVLATVGFHTHQAPYISPRTIIIVGLAAGLWVMDRMLRLSTRIYHGAGNYCTLTPLPEGATRVTMRRSIKASPGSHVFLWIPGVRMFQSHPFTLLANQPVAEFVIAAQDGFTKHLHEAACKQKPGKKFRAAIEGPYGTTPEPREFDKIVLLAGGSGATFTLALALHWARDVQLRKNRSTLEFVWTVKTKAHLHWFDAELAELQACPAVNLRIHITGEGAGQETTQQDSSSAPVSPMGSTEQEKSMVQTAGPSASQQNFEKLGLFEYNRPAIDAIVERAVASVPSTKRVLAAAAGPNGMLTSTRLAASSHMVAGLPSVHLHLEQFGW